MHKRLIKWYALCGVVLLLGFMTGEPFFILMALLVIVGLFAYGTIKDTQALGEAQSGTSTPQGAASPQASQPSAAASSSQASPGRPEQWQKQQVAGDSGKPVSKPAGQAPPPVSSGTTRSALPTTQTPQPAQPSARPQTAPLWPPQQPGAASPPSSVVLGTDDTTGQPVTTSQLQRRQGLYMIGVNGTGKSTLIANLIVQDMQQGLGLCLLDPHGDLTADVLARAPKDRVKDIILLDLMDSGYPFGLNLFECPDPTNLEAVALTAAFVMHVFEKVWDVGPHTPQLAQVLRNVTFTLIQNPGTTLAEVPLLLQDEDARAALTGEVSNPQVRLFWQTYNKLRPHDQLERSSSTLNKADAFLTQPIIANIIGQSHTTIDFRQIMDEGKILLVQLSPRLEDMSMLVGAVIIGQLLNAAMGRRDTPEAQRRQFNLYADEYQRFATEDFATLLSEARKFAVATTIAHQYLDQLDHANRGASVNAANLVAFRVSGQDAGELAREFDATPPEPLVVGYRPLLTPKQDVVDHLVKAGHKSPVVTRFVKTILTNLMADVEVARKQPQATPTDTSAAARFTKVSLGSGIWYLYASVVLAASRDLNTLLYEAMAEKTVEPVIPDHLLVVLASQQQPAGLALRQYTRWKHNYIFAQLKPKPEFALFTRPLDRWQMAEMRTKLTGWAGRLSREQQQFDALVELITLLRATMQALADEPILVDTGQHEPIYDKPRAYQDVENEIATRLANLPNHKARVKVLGGEHLLRTVLPSDGVASQELAGRRAEVMERTRAEYCRPRPQVEAAMRARQEELLTSAGASAPSIKRGGVVPLRRED